MLGAHVHTLRHSYATHLLETAIYTHLTRELRAAALDPINGLMQRL